MYLMGQDLMKVTKVSSLVWQRRPLICAAAIYTRSHPTPVPQGRPFDQERGRSTRRELALQPDSCRQLLNQSIDAYCSA
jgi:hypothetical protein